MLFFLLIMLGCDNSSKATRAKHAQKYRELKLGVSYSKNKYNEDFLRGVKLALEESTSMMPKGKTLKLVVKDDESNINKGILNASELSEDPSVIAVLGHMESYISVPASSIYEFNGVVMLNPFATAKDLTGNHYQYLYRVTPSDESIGEEIVNYFHKHSLKKIALCYVANSYGQSFANAFEARAESSGLDVVDRISYDIGNEAEFHRIVKKWENYEFDSIMFVGTMPEGGNFYKVLKERNINVPVVSGEAMVDEALLELEGSVIDNKVLPAIFHPDAKAISTKTFVSQFKKKYKRDPDVNAALGYDAVKILIKGILDSKSYVPAEISKAIKKMQNFNGAAQIYNFDPSGELILKSKLGMQKIENHKFKYLGSY